MRLQRIGRKNAPSYRVLVVDSHQGPKSGKFVDLIGSYDPKHDSITLDGEKVRAWIAKGVQVSPTVHNLLISQKIIEGKKINVLPKKSPIKKESDTPTVAPAPVVTPAVDASIESAPEKSTETVIEPDISIEDPVVIEALPDVPVVVAEETPAAEEVSA